MFTLNRITSTAFITLCLISGQAIAEDIHYDALRQDGFGEEADLIKSMTPEQRAEVMRQAEIKQQELKSLPPEKLEKLNTQLHDVHDTLYVDQIDPAKLDVSKSKSTQATMKDIKVYQKKYAEGKIHNSAVKPAAAEAKSADIGN